MPTRPLLPRPLHPRNAYIDDVLRRSAPAIAEARFVREASGRTLGDRRAIREHAWTLAASARPMILLPDRAPDAEPDRSGGEPGENDRAAEAGRAAH